VTRAEVDMVRGVDTGAVLRSLMERRLVRIVGHREVPGRPLLYGTKKRFLEIFGLSGLDQLPSLRELEELAREQGLELPEGLSSEDEISEEPEGEADQLSEESDDPGESDEVVEVPAELIDADLAARDDAEAMPSDETSDADEEEPLDDETP
jgi:segregation and condensation protein B